MAPLPSRGRPGGRWLWQRWAPGRHPDAATTRAAAQGAQSDRRLLLLDLVTTPGTTARGQVRATGRTAATLTVVVALVRLGRSKDTGLLSVVAFIAILAVPIAGATSSLSPTRRRPAPDPTRP